MADWYSPNHKIPKRQPKPGELLFELYRERDSELFRCELTDRGGYGVEAQILQGGPFEE